MDGAGDIIVRLTWPCMPGRPVGGESAGKLQNVRPQLARILLRIGGLRQLEVFSVPFSAGRRAFSCSQGSYSELIGRDVIGLARFVLKTVLE
ncbi:hypothetical protein C5Y93_28140 [Blastopirellula marina]|uniref:Uncharacterized protein n=1 Tax=Blastopirellula marina TaxID=124 RepID=A0A2S8GCR4_9BACT|nr:hypothetical protein C5Y93_28140 [Blastopirellula marina]